MCEQKVSKLKIIQVSISSLPHVADHPMEKRKRGKTLVMGQLCNFLCYFQANYISDHKQTPEIMCDYLLEVLFDSFHFLHSNLKHGQVGLNVISFIDRVTRFFQEFLL